MYTTYIIIVITSQLQNDKIGLKSQHHSGTIQCTVYSAGIHQL